MSVTYQRPKQRARSEVLPTNKSQVGYPAKVIGQTSSKVNDWALPLGVLENLCSPKSCVETTSLKRRISII